MPDIISNTVPDRLLQPVSEIEGTSEETRWKHQFKSKVEEEEAVSVCSYHWTPVWPPCWQWPFHFWPGSAQTACFPGGQTWPGSLSYSLHRSVSPWWSLWSWRGEAPKTKSHWHSWKGEKIICAFVCKNTIQIAFSHQGSLSSLFDVLADVPLHHRYGLPSGNANHGLACGWAMMDVHQVHNGCRDCSMSTAVGVKMEKTKLKVRRLGA